ncbi:PIR Superfamily Protein [Plasmodium malariae]|uniref:PIR Superfamily Protein n=1 Tax=Plasmodium malariae TaxID=5858 RepID=A0A1A8X0M6_PLAMA|nr:PIR Superfamily Protein [Plasmodium malariae]
METLTKEELNKILEKSPSSIIYNDLNANISETHYDSFCKDFKVNNNVNGTYMLCKQIARNAEYLSKRINAAGYNRHCLHYKYWIYEKIKNILGDKLAEQDRKNLLGKIFQLQKCINETYNSYYCQYNLGNNTSDEFNKKLEEKYLHDYFHNFDSIRTCDACNRVSFNKYKVYLQNIVTLYEKHKNNNCCDNPWWTECPDYFLSCSDEFDPNKILSLLNSNKENNCNILKTLEKPSVFMNTFSSGSYHRDSIDSDYFLRCTYIKGEKYEPNNPNGSTLTCNVFPTSDNSINNRNSPYHLPPLAISPSRTDAQTKKPRNFETQLQRTELNGSSIQENQQSLSVSLNQEKDIITPEICEKQGLVKSSEGICREPSVRHTLVIGAKWNTYNPYARVKYSPESISVLLRNSDKSNIFSNNIFRVGIAFTLIVGIISTIYIYYKFTPFGRGFHKKVPRKKRIDDYYYDDPHMRHFVIRAPKSVKRKVGSRRLHFSYYSR